MEPTPRQKSLTKWLSLLLLAMAIAYVAVPLDFDTAAVGFVDDFFVFMAAFCFVFAQFSRKANHLIRRQLYTFAVAFILLAVLWVLILAYTPVLQYFT